MYKNVLTASQLGPFLVNSGEGLGRAVMRDGCWAMDEVSLVQSLVGALYQNFSSFSLVEVGAGIGFQVLAHAKHFGDKATVYAFEAQRTVFQTLCGNIALHSLKNVVASPYAVADRHGVREVLRFPQYLSCEPVAAPNAHPPLPDSHTEETAEMVSLDALGLPNVAYIKMDVNGMEYEVFRGAEKTIAAYRPIIVYEWDKTDHLQLLEGLARYNYAVFDILPKKAVAVRAELNLPLHARRKIIG